MLLNLSNHPSSFWLDDQIKAALDQYGSIQDMAFPQISPEWTSDEVEQLVESYEAKIRNLDPTAVHIMGEMTFCYKMINRLKSSGIPCIASTTLRKSVEKDGVKTSVFEFVKFRAY